MGQEWRQKEKEKPQAYFFGSANFPKKPTGLTLETGAGSGRGAALPANCCSWNLQRKEENTVTQVVQSGFALNFSLFCINRLHELFKKGSFCLDCCQISLNKYKLSEIFSHLFYTIVKQSCAWFIINATIIFLSNRFCTDCLYYQSLDYYLINKLVVWFIKCHQTAKELKSVWKPKFYFNK